MEQFSRVLIGTSLQLKRRAAALLLGLACFGSALAEPLPVYIYANPPEATLAELSPGGWRLALLSHFREGDVDSFQLDVVDLMTGERWTPLAEPANVREIDSIWWLDENMLVVEMTNVTSPIVSLDDGETRYQWLSEFVATVHGTAPSFIAKYYTIDEYSLFRVNSTTLERELLDQGGQIALDTDWWANQQGHVVLKRLSYREHVEFQVRTDNSQRFRTALKLDSGDPLMFWPIAFAADGRYFYASQVVDGRRSLVRKELARINEPGVPVYNAAETSLAGYTVFDEPGGRGNLVGYHNYEDLSSALWEEPYATLRNQLEQQFPGANLQFLTIHADSGNYVVSVSRDGAPGILYLGNLQQGSLQPLRPRRSQLLGQMLSRPESVIIAADAPIEAILFRAIPGVPLRGSVVFTHSDFSYVDSDGFDRLAQFLASRGFNVLKLRDSNPVSYLGRYGPQLGEFGEGFKQWGADIITHLYAAREWLGTIGDPSLPACVLGQFAGGSLALLAQAQPDGFFDCAIALDSIVDFGDLLASSRIAGAYWQEEFLERYLGASIGEVRTLSPVAFDREIRSPVLMIDTDYDRHAYNQKLSRELISRSEQNEHHLFEDSYIIGEAPQTRVKTFTVIEEFLDRHFPLPVGAATQ